jgi:hypothetical protein
MRTLLITASVGFVLCSSSAMAFNKEEYKDWKYNAFTCNEVVRHLNWAYEEERRLGADDLSEDTIRKTVYTRLVTDPNGYKMDVEHADYIAVKVIALKRTFKKMKRDVDTDLVISLGFGVCVRGLEIEFGGK